MKPATGWQSVRMPQYVLWQLKEGEAYQRK
jgi:hypothetical protein